MNMLKIAGRGIFEKCGEWSAGQSKVVFLLVAFATVLVAHGAITAYEAQVETAAPPRTEVVVTNIPAKWPTKWPNVADRLFVEVWCRDEAEEPVVISVKGGRSSDGKLAGVRSVVEELPPGGSMGCVFGLWQLKGKLDLNALSNVTVRECVEVEFALQLP